MLIYRVLRLECSTFLKGLVTASLRGLVTPPLSFAHFRQRPIFRKRARETLMLLVRAILQDGAVALEFMTHDPLQAEKMRRQMLLVLPALQ
jgi:hypothetical protein